MNALAVRFAGWFLTTSAQVAILVGLVLLVERLLCSRLPAAWRYALWCKVPVLGSVPLLGRLFRTHRQVETAKALLVLVKLERVGSVASLTAATP